MRLTWRRNQPHYAWVVLAAVMVVLTIGSGIRFSFGVFIDPLVEEYGWSRGAVSFAYTIQFLVGIPFVLIAGWLAERIGCRRVVIIGSVLFTIGMLLTSTVTQIWQFQLYYGVLVNGLGSSVFVTLLPVLISRWFYRKLGLAMGLMWTSVSFGPTLFPPLMRWAIEDIGWSNTFIVFGLISGGLMMLSGFFLKGSPQEENLVPYGGLPPRLQEGNSGSSVADLGLGQTMALTSFWALVAVHTFGCMGHSILLAHMVSMATFAGISSIPAAGVLSLASAISIISRFVISLVAEARGARFTLIIVVLLQTLPTLFLLGAEELWVFYSFAVLFGLGYGGEMVGFPIFNRQYYGMNAPLHTIYAYQMAGALLGMAVGGWPGGVLFDWTGNYNWSILASVVAGSLGVIAALLLPPHRRQSG